MATQKGSIAKVWSVLDAALAKASPKAAATLRGPATDKALARLEKALGVAIPHELGAYLAIHDGQEDAKRLPFVFVKTGWVLLPSSRIAEVHAELCELSADGSFDDEDASSQDGRVRELWWSNGWIPFAVNAGGDYLCIDTSPTKKGKVGQVLWWYHDEGFRDQEHADLAGFFQSYADALTTGKLAVRPDGSIVGEL